MPLCDQICTEGLLWFCSIPVCVLEKIYCDRKINKVDKINQTGIFWFKGHMTFDEYNRIFKIQVKNIEENVYEKCYEKIFTCIFSYESGGDCGNALSCKRFGKRFNRTFMWRNSSCTANQFWKCIVIIQSAYYCIGILYCKRKSGSGNGCVCVDVRILYRFLRIYNWSSQSEWECYGS